MKGIEKDHTSRETGFSLVALLEEEAIERVKMRADKQVNEWERMKEIENKEEGRKFALKDV